MDPKLLMVKCMTLLYREAELNKTDLSIELCKELLESVKIPQTSFEMTGPRDVLSGLKNSLIWMINHSNESYNLIQLQQRIRIDTKDDTYLYHAFVDATQLIEEIELKRQILTYRKDLQEVANAEKIRLIITAAWQKSNFANSSIESNVKFIRELSSQLEPYAQIVENTSHPSMVDRVNFDNEEELERVLTQSQVEMSSAGVLKTGWQGINRMLGETNGFRRGEFALVTALPHNFKTGFMMNLFKHFALYNKPYLRDPEKKPMLLFASLENELPENIMWLYTNLMENATGQPCNPRNVSIKEAAIYIRDTLSVNGYHVEMIRLEPNLCTYQDFFNFVLQYEAQGYEIHAIICDYLSMMSKAGLDNSGPTGANIRELFKRVRNFCVPKGITFITPHQLSTEAKVLTRGSVNSFVKEIANKGYYAECRSLDNDPDLEIVIHIEEVQGQGKYLTCQRGKHRGVQITPEADLYCVLPFQPIGGILDDLLGRDNSSRQFDKVSGTRAGEEDSQIAWTTVE